jgi:hypothetical protein
MLELYFICVKIGHIITGVNLRGAINMTILDVDDKRLFELSNYNERTALDNRLAIALRFEQQNGAKMTLSKNRILWPRAV